jgi:hypothetical protein
VVVRRRPGRFTRSLPDGLDDLAEHNLITFKSYWEALTDWVLKELTGHYVNYRKQVSPRRLLPEDHFRLIAICARRPRDLFSEVSCEAARPGVDHCRRGTDTIHVVVVAELPREQRNALLHLFSAAPENVKYGVDHYQVQSTMTSTIVNEMFDEYRIEGLPMPYKMQDFLREVLRKHLHELSVEERLAGLPAEELLKRLSPEEINAYMQRLGKQQTDTRKKKPKRRR